MKNESVKTDLKSIISKYLRAVVLALILVAAFTYTLIDSFVIPKALPILPQPIVSGAPTPNTSATPGLQQPTGPDPAPSGNGLETIPQTTPDSGASTSPIGPDLPTEPIITDSSYYDGKIMIEIERFESNKLVYYVAHVELSDAGYLRTAFAHDTFGRNIRETTSVIAARNDAIFAINGDFYGFRGDGLIIRNGVLYRDIPRPRSSNYALIVDKDGNLSIAREGEVSGEELVINGALHSFSFGPGLVVDGVNVASTGSCNPRTAIGQIAPLRYVFIVVDGRTSVSYGISLFDLAELFIGLGCHTAYNLDGGGSACMWFLGRTVNNPTGSGDRIAERSISDIIYIGTGAGAVNG